MVLIAYPMSEPVRTERRSTKAKFMQRDLSSFYVPRHKNTGVECVDMWPEFQSLQDRNLSRRESMIVPTKRMDAFTLTQTYVNARLQADNTDAKFVPGSESPLIGNADLVLVKSSGTSPAKPLLVGFVEPNASSLPGDIQSLIREQRAKKLDIDAIIRGSCSIPTTTAGVPMSTVPMSKGLDSVGSAHTLATITNLASVLVVNGLNMGFIASESHIRFVKAELTAQSSYKFSISKVYPLQESARPMLAIAIEALSETEVVPGVPILRIVPHAVPSPDVTPLSKYEGGSKGHYKWWIARSTGKSSVSAVLDLENAGEAVIPGRICVDSGVLSAAGFLLQMNGPEAALGTVSLMHHLRQLQVPGIPRVLAFGTFMSYSVITIQAVGMSVTPADLADRHLVAQMHAILSDLHEEGVMCHRFNIASFLLDRDRDNELTFVGLDKAKLYRRVPEIARQAEHEALDDAIRCHRFCQ